MAIHFESWITVMITSFYDSHSHHHPHHHDVRYFMEKHIIIIIIIIDAFLCFSLFILHFYVRQVLGVAYLLERVVVYSAINFMDWRDSPIILLHLVELDARGIVLQPINNMPYA